MDKASDCILEHAIIYALIEIDDSGATLHGLRSASSRVRRAALVALDQMEGGTLTRELVEPLLFGDDPELLEAIVDVASRRTGWGDLVADILRDWLLAPEFTQARATMLRENLYRLRREAACQAAMADVLSRRETSAEARVLLMKVMIDSGFGEFPSVWHEQVIASLDSTDARVSRTALEAMASTNSGQFDERLAQYARDTTRPIPLRVLAVRILIREGSEIPDDTLAFLCESFSPDAPFETRLDAAGALAKARLTLPQVHLVIDLVARAGPLELPLLLQSLGDAWRHDSDETASHLIAALEASPGFASLSEDHLAKLFEEAPPEAIAAAEPLVRRLQAEYATSLRQVLRTVFNQFGGDAARGKEIFFGKRALCSACHRAGPEKGHEIGPDLRRIGEVRSHRDLLESILAPSASMARGFEPKTIVTKSGRIVSGVVRAETDDVLTLFTAQREEVRIARAEIEEISDSQVSIMPPGLERTLTSDELRDLLAYLSSLKGPQP
jgi:putative heme-binding domain-containing protein